MAGEHELKPLPYGYDALEDFLSKEVVTWHHDKHHGGYVTKRNEIEKKLENIDRSASHVNWSDYGEMKRRESFNASGQILHEIFWENMGGDGNADESLGVVKRIAQDFGSVADWEADFKACATASLGWAILCYDPSDGKLHNYLCDFHNDGAVWGAIPIIATDVFEHAYYRQYGPDRGSYVTGFIGSLNWKAIDERYSKGVPSP